VRMMGTEPPLTAAAAMGRVGGAVTSRRRLGVMTAVAVLIALPTVVFGIPALLGHAVLPGDDMTQNFPLRVLTGQQIRSGHLPLYNPYIWSGAPLLAGWNAGAAYPLTWLFAALPSTAAWTVNLIVTWAVAGTGMFFFLRALRLASLASFLGALSFAFAGAMSAQVSHFGLVAGMSWVPAELLAVLRLSEDRPTASRLRWIAALAVAIGLTVLAGEPRAVDDACVIVGCYAIWQVARLGRRAGPAALSVLASLVLGACLGAVQWLPGLVAISTSQRANATMALFTSGSLPLRWLLLTLVPDLLGGSGSLGQPSFFTGYNLAEVTSYVGILPLVAAFALLGRLRLRPRPPDWLIWHLIALVGVLLALGGNTPLGAVFYRLPLFGDQRLQSRNVLVLDVALTVLFGYWADHPFPEGLRARGGIILQNGTGWLLRAHRAPAWFAFARPRGIIRRRPTAETVLGVLPPLAVIVVVILGFTWGVGLLHWLGVGTIRSASVIGRLKPWLIPYAVIGAGAIALVLFGRRIKPRHRARLFVGFAAVDLVVFAVLGVVAVCPGHASSPSRVTAALPMPAARPISALGYQGRSAIYDPDLIDSGELSVLQPPDDNSMSAAPSVQGYSSIVDGSYASRTGTHQATGEGQDILAPRAAGDGTLDQLDTSILLTLPQYLITAAGGSGPSAGAAGTGKRDLTGDQRATWYLAAPLAVSKIEIPDPDAAQDAAAGTRIGLTVPGGSTRWFAAKAAGARVLAISLSAPVTSTTVVSQAHGTLARLGAPSVTEPDGKVFVADGQLQNALLPPRWSFAGFDGSFAIFADRSATGPLTVQALGGRSASGASVREVKGAADEPAAATVSSPHGARIVRSVAAIPGWTATWKPQHGQATALPVRRDGLVQAVDVPPGRGLLSWNYVSPRFAAGLTLSLATVVLLIVLLVGTAASRPRLRATLGNWRRSGNRGGIDVGIEPMPRSPTSPMGR
jgi:hypothetical protein